MLSNKLQNLPTSLRKSRYPDLYQEVMDASSFLPVSAKIKERIYVISNHITMIPICNHCKVNPVQFLGPSTGYREYCSAKCRANSEKWQEQRGDTCIQKYGVQFPAQSLVVRKNTIATLESKYGKGITSTQQVPLVYEKTKASNYKKYGEYHTNHNAMSNEVLQQLKSYDWLYNQHVIKHRSVFDISNELGISSSTVLHFLNLHNIEYTKGVGGGVSTGEEEIRQFIQSIIPDEPIKYSCSDIISPKHLDIFLPNMKIAVEYNGLYWHSDKIRPSPSYHLNKTKLCASKGIKLIHVMEDDWILRGDIVRSKLMSVLGKTTKIYARSCSVTIIDNTTANIFIEENHIQGSNSNAAISIGLIYCNTIVATMTFCKSRYDSTAEYELLRMCSLLNHTVIGGASRLVNFFIKHYSPNSIVSYCDRRWGEGEVYSNMNFVMEAETPPNYWYFKTGSIQLHSRLKFQKHKLSKILSKFDQSLSEYDNMSNNGYHRIWDCGQLKFRYTNTQAVELPT
jgi:hypothetical protein